MAGMGWHEQSIYLSKSHLSNLLAIESYPILSPSIYLSITNPILPYLFHSILIIVSIFNFLVSWFIFFFFLSILSLYISSIPNPVYSIRSHLSHLFQPPQRPTICQDQRAAARQALGRHVHPAGHGVKGTARFEAPGDLGRKETYTSHSANGNVYAQHAFVLVDL